MRWRVILQPAAEAEMRDAAADYEHAEKGLGRRFLREVAAVRKWLGAMPLRYQAWPTDPTFRAAVVKVFPFVVFYWLDESRRTVVIDAVAHTSLEPGYWRHRR